MIPWVKWRGGKKYQQHIFIYIHTKWIFISHMVHYIFLCKSALLFDEKEITYVCTYTWIYMPVKVKDLERSAVGLLPHLWKMLDIASSSIFKVALPQSFPFSLHYPHTPNHFLEDHPMWGNWESFPFPMPCLISLKPLAGGATELARWLSTYCQAWRSEFNP